MNRKWTSLIGAGTVLVILSSQAMAQPWGGGAGRGRGFGRGQGQGMGWRADQPGPMRQGMGPGGLQGGPGTWCPWGAGPRGRGFGRGPGLGMGWRADRPGSMRQGMGPGGPQGGPGAWRPFGAGPRGRELRSSPRWGQAGLGGLLARRLNLTDDQTDKIRNIVDQSRSKTMAAIKEVLAPEQVKQLEQMRDRAGRFGRGTRGPALQGGPRGPAGGRVEGVPPSNRGQDARDTDFQRGQGRGAGMGPRGQGPAGQPSAGGAGPGRGMRSARDANQPGEAVRPPTGGRGTGPAPMWNRGAPPLEQIFEEADTNKDGTLTREEIRAFHGTRGAGPGWQRP